MNSTNVIFCKKCLTPSTRPRVVFDHEGICNACRNAEEKSRIDWSRRMEEFTQLVAPLRGRSEQGKYDCIVPWSGGKDSSTIAHKLKFEFGLNPLLVTYSPMVPNEIGRHNREEMVKLGFDHLFFRANQKVLRHLAKRFFIERGNPKVAWDAGINAVPIQVAVNYKIPVVFYAEHGESEYGGRVLSEEHRRTRDFTEVIENYVGDDPRNWVDDIVTSADLNPYTYPPLAEVAAVGVKAYYFGYFFKWSMYENYLYIKDKIDFKINVKGRTDGTFTNYDSLDDKIDNLYYYMQFIKFGFGRAVRDASRLIQNEHMKREEGLQFALKYDDEFCYEHFEEVLDYLDLTKDEFVNIVDQHRNPEIWKKASGRWVLINPPC
ncbi:WbuX, N-acetyl sugar amidotransferase [Candidatus Methylopumilus universalis]|uniref:N-acetyl sugar amidotransferase n=1 Tax=Candidatus Methylopumilus universalis TaxID=2588536 RepID=UPI003BEF0983